MATIDSLRYAADNGNTAVALTSLSAFKCYLVSITGDQVGFNDTASNKVRTDTRLTVGKGFIATAPGDGFLNPHISYISKYNDKTGTTVLSGAGLTAMDLMMGPFALPYNTGFASGGLDPAVFQPGPTSASNTNIYVHIFGLGLNTNNGNYYRVKEIVLGGLDNIQYYVRLSAVSDVIV